MWPCAVPHPHLMSQFHIHCSPYSQLLPLMCPALDVPCP
jgi:hypothetical protein